MYNNIIVVPYRDRKNHLDVFKNKIKSFLEVLGNDTLILIVEQKEGKEFNRGKLLNIAVKEYNDSCNKAFIFHDVDTFLKGNDKPKYKNDNDIVRLWMPHAKSCGGICKFKKEVINAVNGHPNNIWGWGIEDRALYYRTVIQGYKTTDIIDERSQLEMLAHKSNIITNYVGKKKEIDKNVTNILSASKEAKQNFIINSGISTLTKINEYDNQDNTILDENEYIILDKFESENYVKIIVDI